jgi:mannose-6-phosphate isomerase-like protein (cupin superfamily)
MTKANWKTQPFNVIQSLLFNNPNRVIDYSVRDEKGEWKNRAEDRTCLQTVQFVHHMLIPPGGRHVKELHIHPDAEELVVITRGTGTALIDGKSTDVAAEDVVYVPPGVEHEFRNTGEEMLGVLFVCVPVGAGLEKLVKSQQT